MPGGFVAERRDRKRQPHIVINALGNLYGFDQAVALSLNGIGAAQQVITTDRYQRVDPQFRERGDSIFETLLIACDVCTRSTEQDAAVQMDARAFGDR